MYDKILPNPNSKHGLTEYLSKRGESKLESFHDRQANFANSGMRNSLADNLNLMGTARCNLAICHKRGLIAVANDENPTWCQMTTTTNATSVEDLESSLKTESRYVGYMYGVLGCAIHSFRTHNLIRFPVTERH